MGETEFLTSEAVDIDIVGFSRGSAMARDFANRVAQRMREGSFAESGACVGLRFIGLWDTVAQFGLNGADNEAWQLAIPPEAQHVFHAAALNEHRYLFPGESIGRGIQRGFIGSHADIGGSYGTGDLSDVALNWIVQQAGRSGVHMVPWGRGETDVDRGVVTNPVLHDKSNDTEDRAFCLRGNNEAWATNCRQQRTAAPGGITITTRHSRDFISRWTEWGLDADGTSRIVGEVNMERYAAWLRDNYDFRIDYRQ
jgi:hypothetical protein